MQKSSAGLELASYLAPTYYTHKKKPSKKTRNVNSLLPFWTGACVIHLYAHSSMSHLDHTEPSVLLE